MTPDERNLITGLFNRLRSADAASKDAEASQLIQQQTAALPGAPYLLVQTLLVQEHALTNALARIKDLEQHAQSAPAQGQSGGGFLSGLFGHKPNPAPQASAQPASMLPPQQVPQAQPQYYAPQPAVPYPTTAAMAPGAGGGFLSGALKTAAGVAGGALLFQGVEGLLNHNAGPFGSALGGGGFGGGGFGGGGGGFLNTGGSGQPEIIERNETVNNYYGDGGDSGGSGTVADDANDHQITRDDASQPDPGFDTSNPFAGAPAQDSSFLGTAAEPDNSFLGGGFASNDDASSAFDSGGTDSGGGGSDDSSYV